MPSLTLDRLSLQLSGFSEQDGRRLARLIAEALHPYPGDLVIGTKAGCARSGPGDWHPDGRPETLRADCEASLRLLRLDCLHLLQLHEVDPDVPLEESLGTLGDLQSEGKVDRIGVSNVTVAELERARAVVDVVVNTPFEAESMSISELLSSQRHWGRARSRKFLSTLSLSENKQLGTLTERSRRLLGVERVDALVAPWVLVAHHQGT